MSFTQSLIFHAAAFVLATVCVVVVDLAIRSLRFHARGCGAAGR